MYYITFGERYVAEGRRLASKSKYIIINADLKSASNNMRREKNSMYMYLWYSKASAVIYIIDIISILE